MEWLKLSKIKNRRHIRVFLSSPGDVSDERNIVLQVIDHVSYLPSLRNNVSFEIVAWDKPGADTPLLATKTPQEAINEGLPKPSECDIVIVLFWGRMGTPLPSIFKKGDGSRYWSGTEWEFNDAYQAAQRTGYPLLVVYRRTDDILFNPKDTDFVKKYEQWQRVEKFFEQFINEDGSLQGGFNYYRTSDEFSQKFESHFLSLVDKILKADTKLTRSEIYEDFQEPNLWLGSPFPGLRSFTSKDAPIFFGRGREVDSVLKKLYQSQFVAVIGSSGSGKSSLVGAGVIPRLQANTISGSQDWIVITFKPAETSTNPFESLATALMRDTSSLEANPFEYAEKRKQLTKTLQELPSGLAETHRYILEHQSKKWAEVLIFIDQFEELFTIIQPETITPFINSLIYAFNSDKLRIIITLRADFYQHLAEHTKLANALNDGTFLLTAPSQTALYEMITKPAIRAGLEFDPGLPETILSDTGDEPGALALMAYTLDELYNSCKISRRLTHESYEILGRVQGAIGERAEAAFQSLEFKSEEILFTVFRELVEVNDHGIIAKKRTLRDQVAFNTASSRLIEEFTKARLLVLDNIEAVGITLEVAHEALFHNWPRLTNWIETTKNDLRLFNQVKKAAREWDTNKRDKAFRWPHERLIPVYDMIKNLNLNIEVSFNVEEREFIRHESDRLSEQLDDPKLEHYERATISDRLATIGDKRQGVGLDPNGLPDLVWCSVSGGSININIVGDKRFALKSEKNNFQSSLIEVSPFFISKYVITYAQYLAFIEAKDGYWNDIWWNELIRQEDPPRQNRPLANHPAENVSLHDAMAFCRWLSNNLGLKIGLPTEAEWLLASGANYNFIYPWGNEWDPSYANTRESGLSRTVAVGMYPQGQSSTGALDMSGNVFEWTQSEFSTGQIHDTKSNLRVVAKGGSWDYGRSSSVLTFREDFLPGRRLNDCGFRCVRR